jgi:hypothetical protein
VTPKRRLGTKACRGWRGISVALKIDQRCRRGVYFFHLQSHCFRRTTVGPPPSPPIWWSRGSICPVLQSLPPSGAAALSLSRACCCLCSASNVCGCCLLHPPSGVAAVSVALASNMICWVVAVAADFWSWLDWGQALWLDWDLVVSSARLVH